MNVEMALVIISIRYYIVQFTFRYQSFGALIDNEHAKLMISLYAVLRTLWYFHLTIISFCHFGDHILKIGVIQAHPC